MSIVVGLSCDRDDAASKEDSGVFTCDAEVCTDTKSNLMWQNDKENYLSPKEAEAYCDQMNLDGYTDWRLPSISELRTLIRGCPETETGGLCSVTDECLSADSCWDYSCAGCEYKEGPGTFGRYWPGPPEELQGNGWHFLSSSPSCDSGDCAWSVCFHFGYIFIPPSNADVRCVRNAD